MIRDAPNPLSLSHRQVIIPKALRDIYHWETGQELIAIDTGDGILLKPKQPFPKTQLEDVAGCLHYKGKAKTLDEMDEAIPKGVMEQW